MYKACTYYVASGPKSVVMVPAMQKQHVVFSYIINVSVLENFPLSLQHIEHYVFIQNSRSMNRICELIEITGIYLSVFCNIQNVFHKMNFNIFARFCQIFFIKMPKFTKFTNYLFNYKNCLLFNLLEFTKVVFEYTLFLPYSLTYN